MRRSLTIILCALNLLALGQTVDPGFSTPLISGESTIFVAQRLTNDRLLIAGNFVGIGTTRHKGGIVVLKSDGTIDNTFSTGTGVQGGVYCSAVQPDGKIILAGFFSSYNSTTINSIVRLNTDGSIDTSFNPGTGPSDGAVGVPSSHLIISLAVQSDGKILVAGIFKFFNGVSKPGIVRLNVNGSIDQTYNTTLTYSIVGLLGHRPGLLLQPDGKLLLSGEFANVNDTSVTRLVRLNADGTIDAAFATTLGTINGYVGATALQSDGKIIISGRFTSVNGRSYKGLARLNSDGSVDETFSSTAVFDNDASIYSITVLPNNSFIAAGNFRQPARGLAKFTANGVYDNSLNIGTGVQNNLTGSRSSVMQFVPQSDGKLILAGNFTTYNEATRLSLARISSNGSLDADYKPNPAGLPIIAGILLAPDNKLYIAGDFVFVNGVECKLGVARLNGNGTIDTGFNISGITETIGTATSLSFDNSGKLLISGAIRYLTSNYYYGLGRFNTDGSADDTWTGFTGLTTISTTHGSFGTHVQADGKVITAGAFTKVNGTSLNNMARLNVDGTLDATFNPTNDYVDYIRNFEVRASDGKIIMAQMGTSTTSQKVSLADANGARLGTFNVSSKFNGNYIYKATFSNSGKILVGGDFTQFDGQPANKIIQLNDDGTRDASFNVTDPMPGFAVTEIVKLPSGSLLVGKASNFSGTNDPFNFFDVIDQNGNTVSEKTSVSGYVGTIVTTGSYIYLAGGFSTVENTSVSSLVRLLIPTGPPSAAPSDLAAEALGLPRRNKLTWKDNSTTETGFDVYRSLAPNNSFVRVGSVAGNETTFTDASNGLTANTLYFYKVVAVNMAGATDFSNVASVTAAPFAPGTPGNLIIAGGGDGSLRLSWTYETANNTRFEIYRSSPTNTSYTHIGTTEPNVTTYTDSGLTEGTTYFYKVRSSNLGGFSPFSNEISQLVTGLHETEQMMRLFPNPTTGTVFLENTTAEDAQVSFVNTLGKRIRSTRAMAPHSTLNFDFDDEPVGIYLVVVRFAKRQEVIKFVKQ